VVAVLSNADTSKLGGTRLLKEIGWRLLRAGHVPLLLGPYSPGASPKSSRALLYEVLKAVMEATQRLNIDPFVPRTLEPDPAAAKPLTERVVGLDAIGARREIRKAVFALSNPGDEPDLLTIGESL